MRYFNEHDPFAAAWLRELYPDATVDERSIADVEAADLVGFNHVALFGGIGGWQYALELAGWNSTRPVFTGSCPCQPFSVAGRGRGTADERHLWPEMRRLIATCRPDTIFGEQVASAAGRVWLGEVRFDLENIEYWSAYHKSLHEVLGAETAIRLSEILRSIALRVEAAVFGLPEGIRVRVEESESGAPDGETAATCGEGEDVPSGLRHAQSGQTPREGGASSFRQEGAAVRLGRALDQTGSTDAGGSLRDDRHPVQLRLDEGELEQPVFGSDCSVAGVRLQQHPGGVLRDECGAGELGRGAAGGSDDEMAREEELGDERAIAVRFRECIKASLGRLRLAGVRADLEALGYAVGAADLCAAGVGAPHIRQRLFWVAVADRGQRGRQSDRQGRERDGQATGRLEGDCLAQPGVAARGLAVPGSQQEGRVVFGPGDGARSCGGRTSDQPGGPGGSCGLCHSPSGGLGIDGRTSGNAGHADEPITALGLGESVEPRLEGHAGDGDRGHEPGRVVTQPGGPTPTAGQWDDSELIQCADGKARRIPKCSIQPLVDGLPKGVVRGRDPSAPIEANATAEARVMRLRGYGNAIVPQLAAVFIRAFLDVEAA